MNKPMKVGLDYVRGANWVPRKFTVKDARRYMEQQTSKSSLRHVPDCTAIVCDCGEHWRGSIAAYTQRGPR